jgi:hypothetical protein
VAVPEEVDFRGRVASKGIRVFTSNLGAKKNRNSIKALERITRHHRGVRHPVRCACVMNTLLCDKACPGAYPASFVVQICYSFPRDFLPTGQYRLQCSATPVVKVNTYNDSSLL